MQLASQKKKNKEKEIRERDVLSRIIILSVIALRAIYEALRRVAYARTPIDPSSWFNGRHRTLDEQRHDGFDQV